MPTVPQMTIVLLTFFGIGAVFGFMLGRYRLSKDPIPPARGSAQMPHYVGFHSFTMPAVPADEVLITMAETIDDDALAADLESLALRVRQLTTPTRGPGPGSET